MELLIKDIRIVDWSQDFHGDVYIKGGKISELGSNLNKDCEIIYGSGMTLLPAFVDLHVHFREPGQTHKEDIESGSRAAVRGGYTLVNLMANTNPVCSDMETVDYVIDRARRIGLIDVHQVVSITKYFDGNDTSHLDTLKPYVKIISEDGRDVIDTGVMLKAMIKAKQKEKMVMCHCEDHFLSSIDMRLAEDVMTLRNLALAQFTGCSVHIAHVSTKKSMEYIIEAKQRMSNVTCEVTPHHIALTDNDYRVNPPIRAKEDVDFIIKAIKDGWVDAISTDHAPHTAEDKKNGAPGMSGIETAFSVCYTKLVKEGHITLSKLSEIMSKRPADIITEKKGQIKIGYDGDLVLVDLDKKYEICSDEFMSKGKNTPFNGSVVYGEIVKTLKDGKVVFSKK